MFILYKSLIDGELFALNKFREIISGNLQSITMHPRYRLLNAIDGPLKSVYMKHAFALALARIHLAVH